jgi:hypothetical protein
MGGIIFNHQMVPFLNDTENQIQGYSFIRNFQNITDFFAKIFYDTICLIDRWSKNLCENI